MQASSFILVLSCVALVQADEKFKRKSLPDYIKPCSLSAPDLNKCIIRHGAQAIPSLLKGDPNFKLAPLIPFNVDRMDLNPSSTLSLVLRNVKFYGLDTLELKNIQTDFKKRHFKIEATTKRLKLESHYNISGQLLILPISGEGPAVLDFDDDHFTYSLDYDLLKRSDGKMYFHNLRSKVVFEVNKAHYQLDNLFNGNKELGESTNKLLNDNSQEVLDDFREAISKVLEAIITGIVKSYLTVIPFDEIFLP